MAQEAKMVKVTVVEGELGTIGDFSAAEDDDVIGVYGFDEDGVENWRLFGGMVPEGTMWRKGRYKITVEFTPNTDNTLAPDPIGDGVHDDAKALETKLNQPRPEDHPAFWPTYQAMFVRCLDAAGRAMDVEDREREYFGPDAAKRDGRSIVARAAEKAWDMATEAVAALLEREKGASR